MPAEPPALVGRGPALAAVLDAVEHDEAIVICGDAGIGKTTLARAAAAASKRSVLEGGALATLSWLPHLALERATALSLEAGDPAWVASAVEARVADGVLVIDDLQWAHSETLAAVVALRGRVAMIVCVRDSDPLAAAVLATLRSEAFEVLELGPLDREAAAALARRVSPDLPEGALARIVETTGGNPLLLEELAATGEASPSLKVALGARIRGLSVDGRRALAIVALAGQPVEAALAGDGVDELVARRLVTRDAALLVPPHALLVDVVVAALSDDERGDAHEALAVRASDPGTAARHWHAAGNHQAARDAALVAAEAAPSHHERADHLAFAAVLADDGVAGDPFRLDAAAALEEVGDLDRAEALLDRVVGDDDITVARCHLLRGRAAVGRGLDPAGVQSAEAGLARVAGTRSPLEVELRLLEAFAMQRSEGLSSESVARAEEVVALARRVGEHELAALRLLGKASLLAGSEDAERYLEDALVAAREEGDEPAAMLAAANLVAGHVAHGHLDQARQLAAEMRDLASAACDRRMEWSFVRWLGDLAVFDADPRAALALVDPVLSDAPPDLEVVQTLRGTQISALSLLGRYPEAIELAEEVLGLEPGPSRRIEALSQLADTYLEAGRTAEGLALLDDAMAVAGPDLNEDIQVALARAWAAVELGEVVDAHCPAAAIPLFRAIPIEIEGIRALAVGDHDRAALLFDQASELWPARQSSLRTRWASAEARRRAGRVQEAVTALVEVEREVASRGIASLAAKVRRSLRACGVQRSEPRDLDRARPLTSREEQVLSLVALGATNAEAASQLCVSRRTVESQVESARRKLGARNRAQAAALFTASASRIANRTSV